MSCFLRFRAFAIWVAVSCFATCALGNPPPLASDRSSSGTSASTDERWVHVTGHAVDQNGVPVEGARVTRLGSGGEAVTDEQGAFHLPLRHDGTEPFSLAFEKRSGSDTLHAVERVELRLDSDRAELGTVTLGGLCEPMWSADFFDGSPGTDGLVSALTVFDDGTGPALYVGGTFLSAGGVYASRVARWDGSSWSALGAGVSGPVRSLVVFDDGSGGGPALYVGGEFTFAGGASARRIAKWNGSFWSALGTGMTGAGFPTVRAMTVFDDGSGAALYAGGDFTTAGSVNANRIAKWDGASWSVMGSGVNDVVYALSTFDDGAGPALYAGGAFITAGGVTVNHIARWSGSSWSPLDTGMDFTVYALTVFDDGAGAGPALYAGGTFSSAGGVAVNRIAKWDGSSWSALGAGLTGGQFSVVTALAVFDDGSGTGPALVAAGGFAFAGGVDVGGVARWNGAAWSTLGAGVSLPVHALTVFDDGGGDSLFAGGSFGSIGGVSVGDIGKFDGASWSALGDGLNGEVLALLATDGVSSNSPALYAGGRFYTAGGKSVNFIAEWNGSSWSALGTGMNSEVSSLAIFDDGLGAGPALYAGGGFSIAGGANIEKIAKWDGSAWSPLGAGMNGYVRALTVFDDGGGPALYAGGGFTTAGGIAAKHIAKWDGSAWFALGAGALSDVFALAVFDDGTGSGPLLYAGGTFGGVANSIAKWNGASWSALGAGLNHYVRALEVFDDQSGSGPALYAGGLFTTAGGAPANYIAKWDGAAWTALGDGTSNLVYALATFDDGTGAGPALYAGGEFSSAGGDTARYIARWDGSSWSPLGTGMGISGFLKVNALTVFDDGNGGGPALFAGGDFGTAGGAISAYIARWQGCAATPTLCPGDANTDLAVNFDDITAVIANWSANYTPGTGPGDANTDGIVDSNDMSSVLTNWGTDCP